MVRETDELREPLEFRFLVDLARTELESWEVRGFEECWGVPCARGEYQSEDALGEVFLSFLLRLPASKASPDRKGREKTMKQRSKVYIR